MEKLKLYHYSNKDIKSKISIDNFNDNTYTFNDYKASKIKRVFYYTDLKNIEHTFRYYNYLYTVEVNKNKIYDLSLDNKKLKTRFNTINDLLQYLKNHYLGAYYSIGDLKITVLFKSVKFKSKIKKVT